MDAERALKDQKLELREDVIAGAIIRSYIDSPSAMYETLNDSEIVFQCSLKITLSQGSS
jgi:hypothetical protein